LRLALMIPPQRRFCPWHGSEFALADGRVINGSATHDQPCLDVRESNGRIEVKRRG